MHHVWLHSLYPRYTPETVILYYEDISASLVHVPSDWSLGQALCSKDYILKAGTPAFIALVRGSKAHQDFLDKYNIS